MTPTAQPITVVYVTGWCRNGSTVLGNTLAEVPGVFHTGELRFLWQNGVLGTGSNRRCGCGKDLTDCELWSAVLADTTPAGQRLEDHAAAVVAAQARWRTRDTGRALRGSRRAPLWPETLLATYRSIAVRTGARVIVDSSKFAVDAALSRRDRGLRVAVVHLVRDPRGSALSWITPKDYTGERSALNSTLMWLGFNRAGEQVVRRDRSLSRVVRYEDLSAEPRATVADVLRLAGLDPAANPVGADGSVELGPNHTVTGNPNRFEQGHVVFREDNRWRTRLDVRRRLLVSALAAPRLPHYGYPLWR